MRRGVANNVLQPELESAIMAGPSALFIPARTKEDTMATAVYPGSFDPVTKGHLDIIKRAAKINDHLIVAVLINSAKHPLFTVEERVALLQECCKGIPNVTVESFDGLTVEFAKKRHASVMVRGLRAVTDFENEIQLAQTNHALMPGIETMFLATSIKWSYLSSTIVKEAARYGSNISKFVTPNVEAAVEQKMAAIRAKGEQP
jgi:pantetheine-phosphate adenylyltransferase